MNLNALIATVLVSISVIAELFGRFGPLYTPALLFLVIGVGRSEDTRVRVRVVARERSRPLLRTQLERRARLAEQERTIARRLGSAESLRRAG